MIYRSRIFPWLALLSLAALVPARSAESAASTEAKQLEQKFPLQQIVLIESVDEVQQPLPTETGFVVATGALRTFNLEELSKRLIIGKGRPIDSQLLGAVVQVIAVYVRQNDFPVADIVVPPQNIRDGVLRLVVNLGKFRTIKTTGNHWFSESLLQGRLGVSQGDTIRLSQLERSIAWANNTNPFRQIKVRLDPVPNTGEFDLVVGVEERLPLRIVGSYDNTGNEVLGIDRYTAAVTYGNMWGRDHQFTYQFTTTREPKLFRAHAINYQAPLRWRHVVQGSVSFVNVESTFLDGFFTQNGKSISADLKYIVPFKRQRWQGEFSGTAGFRETNNNLEFSGTPVIGAVTDTFTAALGAAAIREDTRGKWITSVTLTGSPGKLNSRSGSRIYQEGRLGSNPVFGHAHALVQRSTLLANGLVSNLRLIGQLASGNLLSSEQFSVGGIGTVRGYKERILSGDHGYMASHELQRRLPSVPLGKRLPKLDTAAVLFWDYGRTVFKKPLPGQARSNFLSSVGVGLRANLSHRLSASVDYGRQLEEVEIAGEAHHRVHVKVTASF